MNNTTTNLYSTPKFHEDRDRYRNHHRQPNDELVKVEIHGKTVGDKLKHKNEQIVADLNKKRDSISKETIPKIITTPTKAEDTTTAATTTTTALKLNGTIATPIAARDAENEKKRNESVTQDQIIAQNLKELLERQAREERKANGRLIAVIVAFLVIFLGIYHAWIRKTPVLAGVLVPAAIMLSYAGWVVILAKRDKRKRAMLEKHLEEVAKLKRSKESTATLHHENEKGSPRRTHRKQRNKRANDLKDGLSNSSGSISSGSGSCTTAGSASTGRPRNQTRGTLHAPNDTRVKRLSIRQKLFRQKATTNMLHIPLPEEVEPGHLHAGETAANHTLQQHQQQQLDAMTKARRKKLQRLNALEVPTPPLVRMRSAP